MENALMLNDAGRLSTVFYSFESRSTINLQLALQHCVLHLKISNFKCASPLACMGMVKLQVLLVPFNRKEADSSTLTQWGARKFVHLAEGSSTLRQVCESLVMRYRKLYPDDDDLEIFLVQDNEMCDLDPDFLVDEVLTHGDIIRVIASTPSRPGILDHTMSELSHRAQSTPTNFNHSNGLARGSGSMMEIDTQNSQDDTISRPTIWNGLSKASSINEILVPKIRQQNRILQTLAPSSSELTEPHLPVPSNLDHSMISLPPPAEHEDRSIPKKRSKPATPGDLPTKRITSGMLNAPSNEVKSPDHKISTNLASPRESLPQPSPTKLIDMSSPHSDKSLNHEDLGSTKLHEDNSTDNDSDSGSVMSKQELMDMFKDLFSKMDTDEPEKTEAKSIKGRNRAGKNLMKGLEINMVNAKYPTTDSSTRATRSRLRGNNGPLPESGSINFSNDRILLSPNEKAKPNGSNEIPPVNVVGGAKASSAGPTIIEKPNRSSDDAKVSVEFPMKSKLASVFDKVKKFDAKLTSLNVPRTQEQTQDGKGSQSDVPDKVDQDDKKVTLSADEKSSHSDQSSDLSDDHSSDSDLSASEKRTKPRLAASTPSSSFNSSKPRGAQLSARTKKTVLSPSVTGAAGKKEVKEVKTKEEPKEHLISSIRKPVLNSLTDLARRGVPDVKDASQKAASRPKVPHVSNNSDESDLVSDSSSSSSSSDSDTDSEPAANSKYINAKKLTGPGKKKKSNGGFAALMKDARLA